MKNPMKINQELINFSILRKKTIEIKNIIIMYVFKYNYNF